MTLPSFRWHYGLVSDPAFAFIADQLSPDSDVGQYHCTVPDVLAIYAVAAENAARENLDGWFALDVPAVAFQLGMSADLAQDILEALIVRGRIERETKNGGYFFTAWELDHALPERELAKPPLRLTHQKPEAAPAAAVTSPAMSAA